MAFNEIETLLKALDAGDPEASSRLLDVVYQELRQLAEARLAREAPGHSLQPTALVHEAFLRIAGDRPAPFANRAHFFGAAAEAMRRILIEHARAKRRLKRGGGTQCVKLIDCPAPLADERLVELDEALCQLTAEDPLAARVVELRFFAGLGHEAIAEALDITVYEARRKWTYARAWLADALRPEDD